MNYFLQKTHKFKNLKKTSIMYYQVCTNNVKTKIKLIKRKNQNVNKKIQIHINILKLKYQFFNSLYKQYTYIYIINIHTNIHL